MRWVPFWLVRETQAVYAGRMMPASLQTVMLGEVFARDRVPM